MIYSYFTFNDEFKLLDVKIKEEYDHVDKFIIVEAKRTFTNIPKKSFLSESGLYKNDPKVDILVVPDMLFDRLDLLGMFFPFINTKVKDLEDNKNCIESWQRSVVQFNYPLMHYRFKDDDVIIYGCVDEINRSEDMFSIIEAARDYGIVRIKQKIYMYKINYYAGPWTAQYAMTGKGYRSKAGTFDLFRIRAEYRGDELNTEGKHFSYMFPMDQIVHKVRSIPEYYENDKPAAEDIISRVNRREDPFGRRIGDQVAVYEAVEIDDTYPKTILNCLEDWREFVGSKNF